MLTPLWKYLFLKDRRSDQNIFNVFLHYFLDINAIRNEIIKHQAENMSVPQECDSTENADNILHEDKLVIVQPAASQFYVFACPNIPARLPKSEWLLSARKTQADRT